MTLAMIPESSMVPSTSPALPMAAGETASSAVATQARAQVEARYMVALARPRSLMAVRMRLLEACRRPRFAEASRYAKPVGGQKVVGWSIRFAEEVARALGNVLVESAVVFDDTEQRILRVMVTDLEGNVSYPTDVAVRKVVERNQVRAGQTVVGQRTGSRGQTVYLVEASDDEILNKQNALVSKAMRTGLLRVIPADILEECEEQVIETLRQGDAADPHGTAKKIADKFYALGVMPDRLERVLGNALNAITPAEVQLLRELYATLAEGEATWGEIETTFAAPAVDKETAVGIEAVRQKLAKRKATATTKADDADENPPQAESEAAA
jgi:hypothetical protein